MVGQTILHYKILEKIGEGGMGVVYKAEDTKLERTVAIKFLPRQIAVSSEERERFKIEAKAAACLNHPNIATIHAIEEVDGDTFIVMEYIKGKELKELMTDDGELSIEEVINYATQIAEGLKAAHGEDVTHRDIKSANIMITDKGQVKIMDFGLAKVRGGAQVTKVGTTLGTAAYMSPEQARGEEADHRSDIWSFGVVLYEMLTGKLPFGGDYEQAVMYAIMNEEPELTEEVPSNLKPILKKALAKDRSERIQNAKDFLDELNRVTSNVSTSHASGLSSKGIQSTNSLKRLLFISSLALTALLAVIGYFAFVEQKSTQPVDGAPQRKMIIVLPFENLGPVEDEYFTDGMTEEITSRLASVPELGVIARTSAIQYKSTNKSIAEIGEELGVDYVLEGTVRWNRSSEAPSRVRVTPQLIRVSDATHLWSDRYDRILEDIFLVQSDIAENVIEQLGITLLEPKRLALRKKPTDNLQAYELLLRGKDYVKDWHDEDRVRLAIQMFERAVSLDLEFVEAYAELSQAHSLMYHMGYQRSKELELKAKQAADQTNELAPNSPYAHIALGYFHYYVHKNYKAAEVEFALAETSLPNNSNLWAGRAYVQRRQGRWQESLTNLDKAIAFDPLNYELYMNQGMSLMILRKYQKAEPYLNKAIEARSDVSYNYAAKCSNIWLWKGNIKQAGDILQDQLPDSNLSFWIWFLQKLYEEDYQGAVNLLSTFPDESISYVAFEHSKEFLLGWAYQLDNKPVRAQQAFVKAQTYLKERLKTEPHDFRLHAAIGLVYASLGEKASALREGKRAIEIYPVTKDAFDGTFVLENFAWISTIVDEYDVALEQIDILLSIPSWLSVPLLQLDPRWEPLRKHPHYTELVNKYSGTDE